jgi:hypothetical protein
VRQPGAVGGLAIYKTTSRRAAQREAVRPLKRQTFVRQAAGKRSDEASRKDWCGWGDSNPHRTMSQRIFLPPRFSPPRMVRVRGLDYPFTLALALGAARLVSTPSPGQPRPGAWLGIAM